MHDVGTAEHHSKRLGLKASEYVWIIWAIKIAKQSSINIYSNTNNAY